VTAGHEEDLARRRKEMTYENGEQDGRGEVAPDGHAAFKVEQALDAVRDGAHVSCCDGINEVLKVAVIDERRKRVGSPFISIYTPERKAP
jgi:hypothetical protein